MENIFENFTMTILKINKSIQKLKQSEMREYGLKGVHVMCLYYLAERGKLTSSELIKLTYEDKVAISRALKQLADNGCVVCETKKYNAEVCLTEKGIVIANGVIEKINEAVKAVAARFGEDERKFFHNSLNAVADNLQKYCQEVTAND